MVQVARKMPKISYQYTFACLPELWLMATNGDAIATPVVGRLPSRPNLEIACSYWRYRAKA
ncbi:Uncharacterised protein [Trueperella pyogenes]|nr:hypothetical protein [Trueperella pyogenes]SUO87094.1 Uncharacterised protein [Trueperella pyogenes]